MKQFEKENSPRGDLARDMRDSPMNILFTYREYLHCLKYQKLACREAVETFKECYQEYKKTHGKDIKFLYTARCALTREEE
jgi:hypothetical protein